jgi:hypothetical protein
MCQVLTPGTLMPQQAREKEIRGKYYKKGDQNHLMHASGKQYAEPSL